MWPCKRCLRQEGCLCQVPVALLWGSTCPVLCSSSTRVALLCWLTWTELLNRLISAGSCFCTAWQGRNPVLGLYFYKAMPHPALCAYAQKAGIQEERSSGEGACFPYKSKAFQVVSVFSSYLQGLLWCWGWHTSSSSLLRKARCLATSFSECSQDESQWLPFAWTSRIMLGIQFPFLLFLLAWSSAAFLSFWTYCKIPVSGVRSSFSYAVIKTDG